jgi:uncharacterized membrane protein YeiH
MTIDVLLVVCMIAGVIAGATAGALRAIEVNMDFSGAMLIAFFGATFGGTFRDLVLGAPVFWIYQSYYAWISLSMGLIVFLIYKYQGKILKHEFILKSLLYADALGLAAFSIAGAEKALLLGHNPSIAIFMGMWTAVGGGIAADIAANRPPAVFSSEFYITVSFVGSLAYVGLAEWFERPAAAAMALVIMVLFRIAAVKLKLRLFE